MNNPAGDPDNARFLHEIEALSNALSLHPTPHAPRDRRSQAHVNPSSSYKAPKPMTSTTSSSSSIWDWKPLRALNHLRHRYHYHHFLIRFSLHAHSIERLPPPLADATLHVHWAVGPVSAQTSPARAVHGTAELDGALIHRCPVLARRSGPHRPAKYEPRPSAVWASVAGSPGLDLGRHALDLARLLPLTLEELEGEKASGRWSTSFRLSGVGQGAVLNVSFGYSVIKEDLLVDPEDGRKISEILDQNVGGGINGGDQRRSLRRMSSVLGSKHVSHYRAEAPSPPAEEVKVLHAVLPSSSAQGHRELEDKEKNNCKLGTRAFDVKEEFEEELSGLKSCTLVEPPNGNDEMDCDEPEFVVIEKGIEIAGRDHLDELKSEIVEHEDSDNQGGIGLQLVDEKLEEQEEEFSSCIKDSKESSLFPGDLAMEELEGQEEDFSSCGKDSKESSLFPGDSAMEELDIGFCSLLISESAGLETAEFNPSASQQLGYSEKDRRSLSLDNVPESVANKFLSMLGMENNPSGLSYYSDQGSPEELLCRGFERHSNCGDLSEDFNLSSLVQIAELEHLKTIQVMESKARAKMLEEAEAEALMREWGLDEKAFESSPHRSTSGFGSPIELSP